MKILFLGTHGQKNWGDELMLHVFVHQLSPVVDKFYINSYEPKLTAEYLKRKDVQVFNTRTDKLKLLGYLFRADAVVFGGGNILKELYTAYGGSRYATLGMIDTITKAAKLLGKPIYLCNIGIGPLESSQGKQLTKAIVQRARLTTVRDSGSFQTLGEIQVTTPHLLSSDAVFSVDRPYFGLSKTRQRRSIKDVTDLQKVGISLCRNISNNDNWHYFMNSLAADVLRLYKAHPRLQFIGLPMQFDVSNNNDQQALQELRSLVRQSAPDVLFELAKPESIKDLASVIDQTDLFIGERLHALILSVILGIPVVALEYDVKVTGVMQDLGLSRFGINISEKFGAGSIFRAARTIAKNYGQTTADIAAAYQTSHANAAQSLQEVTQALKEGRYE
ncbi:MAG TPA: polysaccharide pyruvyl transferase family protein [Candidatus Limnocylindria bacterium]|nr:polysaccharide pyruvyl transferase family protein [Candidatus Limnocylindria bacterium]